MSTLQSGLSNDTEEHRYKVDNPEIHIAYMLLRSGLNDLETLLDFLANTGAAQIVVSSFITRYPRILSACF